MHVRSLTLLLPIALSLACTPPLGKLGEVAGEEGEGTGEGSGGQTLPPENDRMAVLQIDDGALDVLFVIDNSGSMSTRQAWAAESIGDMVQAAQAAGVDLRVGFTTTDNGNPWCQGTSPEAGQLRLSTCTSRLPEFIFEGAITIDAQVESCLDQCGLESIDVTPTATHVDDSSVPRPWIEVSPSGTNLGGLDVAQVARCAAPQGINGCGFESPLESMRKSIERSTSMIDSSYGFLRPWARFAVVFISDEVDCSVDSAWEEIFLPDGNRVFWEDDSFPAPTSAVCWNAGVQCQAETGDLGACNPQNYDVEGNVTDAASAVMRSLSLYIADLQQVEQSKEIYRPIDSESVMVGVIAGVPSGYADGEQELVYQRGVYPDPTYVGDFGVDPGCDDAAGTGVPPVRLRALAELFTIGGRDGVFSVCDPNYSPLLDQLLATAATQSEATRGCVPGCVADTDAAQGGTQAQCDVILNQAGETERESVLIPSCGDADASATEPCYELRLDDQAAACSEGSNAELELVLPEGATVRGQLTVDVVCEMDPAGSC